MQGKAPDFGSVEYGAEIGEKVRKRRREIKDLTIEELAARLREVGLPIKKRALSKLERGERMDVTIRELDALAYALGCSRDDLCAPFREMKK